MEQFTNQQRLAQVIGAEGMYQATVDLIERINDNAPAVNAPLVDIHVGDNVEE